MKQLFLIAAIIFSVTVNAQAKKDSTIKKAAPIADSTYVLGGKLQDFQLLFKAVTSPGDVTPNQISALTAWIQKIQLLQPPKKN